MRHNLHPQSILNHLKKMVLKKELLFTNRIEGVFLHRRTSDNGFFIVGTSIPVMPSDPLAFFGKDNIRKDYNYCAIDTEAGAVKFSWCNNEYMYGGKTIVTESLPESVKACFGAGMLPSYVTEWQKERMEEAINDFGTIDDFPIRYSRIVKAEDLTDEQRRIMGYNLEALEKANGKPTVCDYEEFRGIILCRTVYANGLEATSYALAE